MLFPALFCILKNSNSFLFNGFTPELDFLQRSKTAEADIFVIEAAVSNTREFSDAVYLAKALISFSAVSFSIHIT